LLDCSVEGDGTVILRISYRFLSAAESGTDEIVETMEFSPLAGQEATDPDICLIDDEHDRDDESALSF
jgi:hypothetical protein